MSTSAFAGSPLLISPELLLEEGLIQEGSLTNAPVFSEYSVDFPQVSALKGKILEEAFSNFPPVTGFYRL